MVVEPDNAQLGDDPDTRYVQCTVSTMYGGMHMVVWMSRQCGGKLRNLSGYVILQHGEGVPTVCGPIEVSQRWWL